MLTLVAALSGAILLQSAPVQEPEITEADAQKALELTQQMLFVMGTCEAVFPPEVGAEIQERFNQETDPQARALIQAAYDAGKASPKAATQTMESCSQDIQATLVEIQALAARLNPEVN